MTISKKSLVRLLILPFLALGLSLAVQAGASVAPTLSLSATGDGDYVSLTVSGDANSSVLLYYTSTAGSLTLKALGSTNSSGSFTGSYSTAALGVATTSVVYAKVGGASGAQSASVAWPYEAASESLSLSSTGVVVSVGNSTSVYAYNVGTNLLYLSNNSNPSVANVNINGSTLTVLGLSAGQTVATVCTSGSVTGCVSAYITVTNSGASSLTFSQTSATIAYGQSLAVTIYGGTGAYTVLNNSNSSVATASISGSVVTLTAIASSGTSAVTVCSTDYSSCGIITVTAGSVTTSGVSFSQSNPVMGVGDTLYVTLSGATSNTYSLSTNSNTSVVSASVSGDSLVLVAKNIGTATVAVCAASGNCNVLTATVSYTSSGGRLTLSQTALSLIAGQSASIIISGGTTPYSLGVDGTSTLFTTNLNSNVLTVTGVTAGSDTIDICSAGSACVTLSVYVNSSTVSSSITLSQSSVSIAVGNSTNVAITGTGSYTIANTNSSVVTAAVSGSSVYVYGSSVGSATLTVCQTTGQCAVLYVTVTAAATTATTATTTTATTSSSDSSALKLIKTATNPAVYAVIGNVRRLYSNSATFWSWHLGAWADNPVTVVSQDEFSGYTVGKNMTARSGALIQFDNSSMIYAVVGDNKLCHINATSVAARLYGSTWKSRLLTIQSSFEVDYTVDSSCKITADTATYPDGSLIQYAGFDDIWYIQNGQKRLVSDSAFTLNKFNSKYLIKNVPSTYSFTTGSAITGKETSIFNLK